MKTKDFAMLTLSALVVIGFFCLLAALVFTEIPAANKEVLYLAVGSLLAAFATVVSYFLGSSAGSAQKADTLAKDSEEKTNIIKENVKS